MKIWTVHYKTVKVETMWLGYLGLIVTMQTCQCPLQSNAGENLNVKKFRFSGGEVLPSLKEMEYAVIFRVKLVRIRSHVVNSSIPLLWSRPSIIPLLGQGCCATCPMTEQGSWGLGLI